jgi:hypothetical protein
MITIFTYSKKHLHSLTQWITSFLRILLTEQTETISVYRFNLCLGALAKLRKAPESCLHHVCPSLCMSVRPSLRMEKLGYHWTDFHEILYEG